MPSEVAQYDERAMRRLSVKPGLTGYWQVSGRSDTTFDDMVDLDLCFFIPVGFEYAGNTPLNLLERFQHHFPQCASPALCTSAPGRLW